MTAGVTLGISGLGPLGALIAEINLRRFSPASVTQGQNNQRAESNPTSLNKRISENDTGHFYSEKVSPKRSGRLFFLTN